MIPETTVSSGQSIETCCTDSAGLLAMNLTSYVYMHAHSLLVGLHAFIYARHSMYDEQTPSNACIVIVNS